MRALLGMINTISEYGLPNDYVRDNEQIINNMTIESHKALAEKYVVPDKMFYLIVGDAETQLKQLKEVGFGDPIVIDRNGDPIK